MGVRRLRRERRAVDMALSRTVNGHLKTKERARRDARMVGLLEKGKYPFTPAVMSWLSVKLETPAHLITEAHVGQLVKATKAAHAEVGKKPAAKKA